MYRIFINPGHAPKGDPDPGSVNAITGLRECDVALATGEGTARYLQAANCETSLLQSDDLAAVVLAANDWPADLFISIHCNSAVNVLAQGTEVWYCSHSQAGPALAECLQEQIVQSLPLVDRGLKEAMPGRNGLYVLTNTAMTACLIELAFISHVSDEQLLANPASQEKFASAIARGITDYMGKIYPMTKSLDNCGS